MLVSMRALVILLLCSFGLRAQSTQMTLADCISYGLSYHPDIKIAQLQRNDAEWQVKESKGGGLPQLTAGASYQYFLKKPAIPAEALGFQAPAGTKISFVQGQTLSADATLSQLLFSNSYRFAVKAAQYYREYVAEQEQAARKKVKDNITAAYLPALLISDNLTILDKNIKNLETLLSETTATQKAGFVEQLDVDRLDLSLSTLRSERENLSRQRTTVIDALKFAMGYPVNNALELTDNTNQLVMTYSTLDLTAQVDVNQRPEYRQLLKGRELSLIQTKIYDKPWLPTIAGFVNYQGAQQGNSLWGTNAFFVPQSVFGLSASFNLYDGGQSKAKRERSLIATSQIDVQRALLENAFKLEWEAAKVQYQIAQDRIKSQQKNLDLAQRIFDTTQKKYKAGIGSSFEMVTAEQALYTSQQSMMQAQFDLLTAYAAAQKALNK